MVKDNIEVGEYIRTKDNTIDRIADIRLCESGRTLISFEKSNNCRSDIGIEKYILKHSKNILDLIEVGDIVKTGVDTIFINDMETQENLDYFKELYKNDIDVIRAIITHEQIEEMEYRV